MGVLTMRALAPGEVALARPIYGEEISWARVRVAQLPALGFAAFVPWGPVICYSSVRARADISRAPLSEQGLFIHELAHVWQAEQGCVLALAKLGALGRGAYRYEARAGARLCEYNIESQAEIARHLFLARAGAPAPAPRAWLEEVWASRRARRPVA